MKKTILFFTLFLTTLLNAQSDWHHIGEYGFPDKVFIYNADHYAVPESSELLLTTNGGESFQASQLEVTFNSAVITGFYVSEETMILIQSAGLGAIKILKSTDGGMNFTDLGEVIMPENYQYLSVTVMHFFNETDGVMELKTYFNDNGEDVLTDLLVKTTDSGASWSIAAPTLYTDNSDEYVFSAPQNIKLFANGGVYESNDLGNNWTTISEVNPLTVIGRYASINNMVWGVGNGGANQYCNIVSTEGGANYSDWIIPGLDCGQDVGAVSANSLVVTDQETTLHSTDGGDSYSVTTFPEGAYVSGGFLSYSQDGLSYLYKTFDDTWIFNPGGANAIAELENGETITAYPNPSADGVFNLSMELSDIQVFNQLGSIVHSQVVLTNRLDLSHLESGVYLITSGALHFKVIIE